MKKKLFKKIQNKAKSFLKRRPHRTLRLTRRRDYARSLKLPSYIAFTKYVAKTIWDNRKLFACLALFYAVLTIFMVGIASQDTYDTLVDTLNKTSGDLFSGGLGEIGKAGLLFISSATGGISENLSDIQQVYAGIITILTWLTSIWLLRNILANRKVKLRDGLYNAGSPIIATFIVALVFMIQLLPIALAIIGYSAASLTGLLDSGVEAMLFWAVAALLSTLSVYWVTSTLFALVIVTLPGMYPFNAMKTAGDLVAGRRLRILLRFVWMAFITVLTWAIIMIPVILLDKWIKGLWTAVSWVPTVPIVLLALGAITIVWISSYVYLLYRKVVADDAAPA